MNQNNKNRKLAMGIGIASIVIAIILFGVSIAGKDGFPLTGIALLVVGAAMFIIAGGKFNANKEK